MAGLIDMSNAGELMHHRYNNWLTDVALPVDGRTQSRSSVTCAKLGKSVSLPSANSGWISQLQERPNGVQVKNSL